MAADARARGPRRALCDAMAKPRTYVRTAAAAFAPIRAAGRQPCAVRKQDGLGAAEFFCAVCQGRAHRLFLRPAELVCIRTSRASRDARGGYAVRSLIIFQVSRTGTRCARSAAAAVRE